MALEIVDAGLLNADPYVKTRALVRVEGSTLWVGEESFDLNHYKRIYILGAGKATFPIAKALDEVLGDLITDGVVICKYGQEGTLKHSRLYFSSHPTPDENGYKACQELMTIARQTVHCFFHFYRWFYIPNALPCRRSYNCREASDRLSTTA